MGNTYLFLFPVFISVVGRQKYIKKYSRHNELSADRGLMCRKRLVSTTKWALSLLHFNFFFCSVPLILDLFPKNSYILCHIPLKHVQWQHYFFSNLIINFWIGKNMPLSESIGKSQLWYSAFRSTPRFNCHIVQPAQRSLYLIKTNSVWHKRCYLYIHILMPSWLLLLSSAITVLVLPLFSYIVYVCIGLLLHLQLNHLH